MHPLPYWLSPGILGAGVPAAAGVGAAEGAVRAGAGAGAAAEGAGVVGAAAGNCGATSGIGVAAGAPTSVSGVVDGGGGGGGGGAMGPVSCVADAVTG